MIPLIYHHIVATVISQEMVLLYVLPIFLLNINAVYTDDKVVAISWISTYISLHPSGGRAA